VEEQVLARLVGNETETLIGQTLDRTFSHEGSPSKRERDGEHLPNATNAICASPPALDEEVAEDSHGESGEGGGDRT
jgi:hypothetical protein